MRRKHIGQRNDHDIRRLFFAKKRSTNAGGNIQGVTFFPRRWVGWMLIQGKLTIMNQHILGMAPSQDASDQQDYEPFLSRESQAKPLFATVTGKGPHPTHIYEMYPHLISHDIKLYQIIHVNPTKYTFQFGYLLSGADFFEFRHVPSY